MFKDLIYEEIPLQKSKRLVDASFTKGVQTFLQIQKMKPSYESLKEHNLNEQNLSKWFVKKIYVKPKEEPKPVVKRVVKKRVVRNYFWRLEGIVLGKTKRAIINGKLVKIGDEVGGGVVVNIAKDKVLMKADGKSRWVKLLDTVPRERKLQKKQKQKEQKMVEENKKNREPNGLEKIEKLKELGKILKSLEG